MFRLLSSCFNLLGLTTGGLPIGAESADAYGSRQILFEPSDALLLSIVHCLFVLLATPIASQREAMDLVFVDLESMSVRLINSPPS